MTIIDKIKDLLRMLAENIHKRRRVVLALSCVVVFVTTYMLILPAFTLEKTKAAEQGGIDVPGVTTTAEDVSEEDADANDGQTDAQDVQTESGKTEDGKVEDSGSQSKDSGEAKADSAQTTDPLTFEDEHYTIAVDDKNSVLPENTEIKVEEIDKNEDAKKYQKHFDDALAAIQEEKDGENVSDLEFARFYDISLVSDGKEVTLGSGDKVSVNIEYDKELRKALGVENKDNIRIIHFAENKDTGKVEAEVLDNKEAKVEVNTDKKDQLKEASFEAESFSVYAVVYTVDFEYEDEATHEVYKYSMEGGSSITLKKLAVILGITAKDKADEFIANVEDVKFSDEKLVKVEKTDNGWTLKSLKAFDTTETLTITMKDGKVYEVKVTDDNVSDNLRSTLATANITIDGQTVTGNTWHVKAGQPYKVSLTFAEVPSGAQFDTSADTLVYKLPDSFNVTSNTSGNIDFTYDTGSGTATITGSTYTYDPGSKSIIVTLSDEAKSKIADSGNAKFNIDIWGEFDSNATQIEFNDTIKKNLDIDDNHDLSITKDGHYDSSDGKVHYTVQVKSTGVSTNINVTDSITGSALSMDANSVQVSGNSGTASTTYNTNGFTTTIDKMYDGEIVTITYTASVDFAALNGKSKDDITAADTGNTVKVTGKDDPGEEASKVIVDNFDSVNISKQAGNAVTVGNESTIPWTITYNSNQKQPAGGVTITDTITGNAVNKTHYSGNGITVKIYEGDTVVDTIEKTWAELGVTSSTKTWNYTLPNDNGEAYKYVINYTTTTDVTGMIGSVDVKNTSTDHNNHDSSGTGHTTPGEDGVTLTKTHTAVTRDTITWEVKFNVPTTGLSTAVVTDNLPSVENFRDSIDPDNISVSGLLEGESYSIDTSDPTKVLITFYKDEAQTETGLLASENSRDIVVTLTTDNDPDWVTRYGGVDVWQSNHTNKAKLDADGYVFTDEDAAKPITKGIQKNGSAAGTVKIGGVDYPVFKYTIDILGWSENSFPYKITDSFDTDYLRFYDYWNTNEPAPQGADSNVGALKIDYYGGTYTGVENNGRKLSFSSTDTGFSVTINRNDVSSDNINKPHRIEYYLIVKDQAALNALLQESLNSADDDYKVPLENTATDGDSTSKQTVDYQYPAVDKSLLGVDSNTGLARYEIVLNPNKVTLNQGNQITMTDTFSNLSVDFSSVRVTLEDSNGNISGPYNTSSDQNIVKWNYRGNTGTFYIPDRTKVTITYTARVTGEGGITISNTASMLGFSSSVVEDVNINSTGSGSLDINRIWLFKHEGGDMTVPLSGIEFTLVDANGHPVLYPATATNDKAGQPITFTTGTRTIAEPDGTTTTLAGYADIFLSEQRDGISLQKGVKYYLKETKAADGYQIDDTVYGFTIADHPDYSKYEYHIGDVLRVNNWPQEGVIKVHKTLVGAENLTDTQKKQITFTLEGTPADGSEFETKTFTYGEFTSGAYTFEELKPGTYTVTETGYELGRYHYEGTTTSSENGTVDEQHRSVSFEITQDDIDQKKVFAASFENTYSTNPATSLTVKKTNPDGRIHLYDATFQILKKNGHDIYVPLEDAEPIHSHGLADDSTFTIDYENRNTGVNITQLGDGDYKLVEITAPAGYVKTDAEMTFSVNNGEFTYTDSSTQSWTKITEKGDNHFTLEITVPDELDHSYTFTKVAYGNLDAHLKGAEFTVYEYVSSDESNELFTLSTDDNGQFAIDDRDPEQSQHLQSGHAYYVVETKAPTGYKLPSEPKKYFFYFGNLPTSISANTLSLLGNGPYDLTKGPRQEVLENEKETTKIEVKKVWNDQNTAPDDSIKEISFKVMQETWKDSKLISTKQYPDNETLYTITKAQWEAWQKLTVDNLPTGDSINGDVVTYKYSVEEIPIDGYKAYYPSGSVTSGEVIINNKPTPSEITVNKVWVDGENNHDPIQVELIALNDSGQRVWYPADAIRLQTLNSDNGWSYTWEDLDPSYKYYVEEKNAPSGYTVSYSADKDIPVKSGSVTITNTKKIDTGIAVYKKWVDENGNTLEDSVDPINVNILRQKGKPGGHNVDINVTNYYNPSQVKHETANVANNGSITLYFAGNQDLTSDPVITGSYQDVIVDRTLNYGNDASIKITGIESDINVSITANGTFSIKDYDKADPVLLEPKEGVSSVALSDRNNWYSVINDLETDAGDGYFWYYSIEESGVPGYSVSYENNNGIRTGTIIVTNQKLPPIDFSFTKLWENENGGIAVWPEGVNAITVTLKRMNADGEEDKTFNKAFTLRKTEESGENGGISWTRQYKSTTRYYTYTFEPLDAGYTYYIEEENLGGYTIAYADKNRNRIVNAKGAPDEGYIYNIPESAVILPMTGGIGTTIFYILGSILVIGGGIYFISRRRAMK